MVDVCQWLDKEVDIKCITVKKMNQKRRDKIWQIICSFFGGDAQGRNEYQGGWKYVGTIYDSNGTVVRNDVAISPWVFYEVIN